MSDSKERGMELESGLQKLEEFLLKTLKEKGPFLLHSKTLLKTMGVRRLSNHAYNKLQEYLANSESELLIFDTGGAEKCVYYYVESMKKIDSLPVV